MSAAPPAGEPFPLCGPSAPAPWLSAARLNPSFCALDVTLQVQILELGPPLKAECAGRRVGRGLGVHPGKAAKLRGGGDP